MYKSETDTQELKVTFLDDFKITNINNEIELIDIYNLG